MKIARGDPPKLRNSPDYSFPMNKFIEICLQKNPRDRPTCAELSGNQWIDCVESNKPLRQLLAETRAEVLEEVIKQADQTTRFVFNWTEFCQKASRIRQKRQN